MTVPILTSQQAQILENLENNATAASCRYNFLKRISPIIPASNGIVLGSQGIIIIFPS